MQSTILIATSKYDPHADVVVNMVTARGNPATVVYPGDIARKGRLTTRLDKDSWSTTMMTTRGSVDLDEVGAVWWRKVDTYIAPASLPLNERIFAEREGPAALRGVWESLGKRPGVYWMSHPMRIAMADNKLEQLERAATLGFAVPRTLVTNEPDAVRAFYDDCDGNIIHKALVMGIIGANHFGDQPPPPLEQCGPMMGTARVTPELLAHVDAVRHVPGLFQEIVPKRVELRVTVIGDQVFTAAIHSQDDPRTATDWRLDPFAHNDITWAAAELPEDVQRGCLEMTRAYGLQFGAFDFIVTPEGDYVFLEINPNGQWLFVQEKVPELRMAQAVADILINNSK